jgi:hypothetical protein
VKNIILDLFSPVQVWRKAEQLRLENEQIRNQQKEIDEKLDKMIAELNGEDEWFLEIRKKKKEDS